MKTDTLCRRKALFPICLLISGLLTAAPFLFMKIYYMFGDDYLMNYIANGSYGEEFSDHLIFPRILFGKITKLLYSLTKNVNWYALLLALTIALAWAVCHWIILKNKSHIAALLISLFMNAVTVPLLFTFTVAAFLAVAAGIALIYYSFYEERPLRHAVPGALLVLWGYVVRNTVFVPTLAVASPLALHAVYVLVRAKRADPAHSGRTSAAPLTPHAQNRNSFPSGDKSGMQDQAEPQRGTISRFLIRNTILLAAVAAASLVILFLLRIWEQKEYGSPVWMDFRAYNYARGEVLDYPQIPYEVLEEGYESIGFTREEYELLYRWTFCEKNSFPRQKFLEISMVESNVFSNPWRLAYTKTVLRTSPNYFVFLLPLAVFLLLLAAEPRFHRFTGFLIFGASSSVILALSFLRLRFVLRVAVPLAVVGIIFMLISNIDFSILLSGKRRTESSAAKSPAPMTKDNGVFSEGVFFPADGIRKNPSKAGRVLTMLFSVLLVLLTITFLKDFNRAVFPLKDPAAAVSSEAALEEIRSHPENIYLTESYAFSRMYYYGHPVSEVRTIVDYRHLIRAGSWDSFTPRYYKILEDLGFGDPDNLLSALLTKDNFYLITDRADLVRDFLESVTGRKVLADVRELGDGVLKVVKYS